MRMCFAKPKNFNFFFKISFFLLNRVHLWLLWFSGKNNYIRIGKLHRKNPRLQFKKIKFSIWKPVTKFCPLFDSENDTQMAKKISFSNTVVSVKRMSVSLHWWFLQTHNVLSKRAVRKRPKPRMISLLIKPVVHFWTSLWQTMTWQTMWSNGHS